MDAFEEIVIEEEKPVADEAVVVLSRGGFVKRMAPKTYERAAAGEPAELPKRALRTMTDRKLAFFTDRGNCYPIAVEQIPDARPKDRGIALGGLLAGLESGETAVAVWEMGDSGDWLFVTALGMAKRTARADYNVRKSKFAAINLREGDSLIDVLDPEGYESALLVSEKGMAIHFAIEEVSRVGRAAAGVKAMALGAGDCVRRAFVHNSEGEVILASELGYLKRCLLIDFDRQARGGKGVRSFNFVKNGANGTRIADALLVRDPFDFRIVQKSGASTPVNSEDVAIESKAGRGTPYVVVVMDDFVVECCPLDAACAVPAGSLCCSGGISAFCEPGARKCGSRSASAARVQAARHGVRLFAIAVLHVCGRMEGRGRAIGSCPE